MDHPRERRAKGITYRRNIFLHQAQELPILGCGADILENAQQAKHKKVADRLIVSFDLLLEELQLFLRFLIERKVDNANVGKTRLWLAKGSGSQF